MRRLAMHAVALNVAFWGALCSWERAQASLGVIPAASGEITKQAKVDKHGLREATAANGAHRFSRSGSDTQYFNDDLVPKN